MRVFAKLTVVFGLALVIGCASGGSATSECGQRPIIHVVTLPA